MSYKSTHRYARISPRKVRPIADMIRGKFADEALEILRFQPHRGSGELDVTRHEGRDVLERRGSREGRGSRFRRGLAE